MGIHMEEQLGNDLDNGKRMVGRKVVKNIGTCMGRMAVHDGWE